ncbi:MAG: hypothetical protein AAF824_12590 [Bacteroidota bacterium]
MGKANSILHLSRQIILLLLLSTLISSCGAEFASSDPYPKNRRELLRSFRESGKLIISYSHNSPYHAYYDSLAHQMLTRNDRISTTVKTDQQLTKEDLQSHALLFMGTLPSTGPLSSLAGSLPVTFSKQCIDILGSRFEEEGMVVNVNTYPNPLNPMMPIWLTTGLTDEAIIDWLNRVPEGRAISIWGQWGIEVFGKEEKLAMGQFAYAGATPWKISSEAFWDLRETDITIYQAHAFKLAFHGGETDSTFLQNWATIFMEAEKLLPEQKPLSQEVAVKIFPSAEKKGLVTGITQPCHCEVEKATISITSDPIFNSEVQAGIRRCLSKMAIPSEKRSILQLGLPIFQLEEFEGYPLRYWEEKLYRADYLKYLPELMAGEVRGDYISKVDGLLLALWVKKLSQVMEPDELTMAIYEGQEGLFTKAAYLKWLKELKATYGKTKAANKSNHVRESDWYQGFNLAHEGYQIYNGYVSEEAMQATALTKEIGANATAIVPYTFMRNPRKATALSIPRFAGGENDESVGCITRNSHELGLTVLLKPQIWLSGSWPGDIDMESEKEWAQFFHNYERWMMHYAFLATIHEADMLCVGVEMVHTTLEQPDRWRDLIQHLRAVYEGPLVYAANWGEEFEKIEIWDELDYIGFNCYYPLSDKPEATKKELISTFTETAQKAEAISKKFDRPLLFTEIGFRSIQAPWMHPHAEAGDAAFNEQDQRLAYEAVCAVLAPSDWMKGIFWWKWPSYTSYHTEESKSFTPMGKAAQQVVEEWFLGNIR